MSRRRLCLLALPLSLASAAKTTVKWAQTKDACLVTLVWGRSDCSDEQATLTSPLPPDGSPLVSAASGSVLRLSATCGTEQVIHELQLSAPALEPVTLATRRKVLHLEFRKRDAASWPALVSEPTAGVRIERDWNRGGSEEEEEEEEARLAVDPKGGIAVSGGQTGEPPAGGEGSAGEREGYSAVVDRLPENAQRREQLILAAYRQVRLTLTLALSFASALTLTLALTHRRKSITPTCRTAGTIHTSGTRSPSPSRSTGRRLPASLWRSTWSL